MITRRNLLKGLAASSAAIPFASSLALTSAGVASGRPAPDHRSFRSTKIDSVVKTVKAEIGDKKLATLFENCFPNTLDTTVQTGVINGKPDTFIITGDIDAMWLRDSCAQVWPYLPYVNQDKALQTMFRGLIHRHAMSIIIDPYANAFMRDPTAKSNLEWSTHDHTEMKPGVAERKWEIDSLCYAVRLSHGYWKQTGDTAPFDDQWREAMKVLVNTFKEQQRLDNKGPYYFQRRSNTPTETLAFHGYGAPTKKVGMIHSGFRPSDDACEYLFLIPSNHFAVVSLRQLVEMAPHTGLSAEFAATCQALADQVNKALHEHGVITRPNGDKFWAYEVDGYDNTLFMDDANIPSLLSLPYLGAVDVNDALYQSTRAAVWSDNNPYFFDGSIAAGIGGPHAGLDLVWPMSFIMRALTSTSDSEIKACLNTLKTTDAGTGFMHEAFHKDDPATFTRPWFAWANTLFGELILKLHQTKPYLLS